MTHTVMIVEDELLIGLEIEQCLIEKGYSVAGPFVSPAEADRYLDDNSPDAAILDINLGGGETSLAIARRARENGIPHVFLTGYAASDNIFDEEFSDIARISKPCVMPELLKIVRREIRKGGKNAAA